MKVYLAGPMRGIPELNFPAFHKATAVLRAAGWEVVSPAEEDEKQGFDPLADTNLSRHELATILKRDIDLLVTCDVIILLPGWEDSRGAKFERAIAENLGLLVMNYWDGAYDEKGV